MKSNEKCYVNDMKQLELLYNQFSIEVINTLVNIVYLGTIGVAINNIYRKYKGEDKIRVNPDYIVYKTATASVFLRIAAIKLAVDSYKLAIDRVGNHENNYSLNANERIIKATVIALLASIMIQRSAREYYNRTIPGVTINI